MKRVFVITLLFFLSLYIPTYATGTPTIFSYQGRLTNAAGNLLGDSGTTYYFKFSIWNVATDGTTGVNRLWPVSDPASVLATVRQGVFNVDIDTTNYNFNTSSNVYLQVEVSSTLNGTYEALTPRQRISAAPFAQISGAVSGIGQSSFGTTTPFGTSLVSIEATSTGSTGLSIRGMLGQLANLFQIQNSAGTNLFVVDNSGNVGVGTSTPGRKFDVSNTNSSAQLRLGTVGYPYGEFYVDSFGDVQLSSNSGNGGNIRMSNENLWVCSGGSCNDAVTPVGQGNIVVETAVIFNNKFKFALKENPGATTTTVMLDSSGNEILEFDEGQ